MERAYPDGALPAWVGDTTPVLVGVGTASTRASAATPAIAPRGGSDPATADLEPVDLMVDAAAAALDDALAGTGDDAARNALLGALGMVAVPEGNWSYPDPGRIVASRLGALGAATVRVDIGVPQCTPIRVAAERIAAGDLDAALIVGGETKATQQRIARAGGTPPETDQGDVEPDERWTPRGELMAEPEIAAGLWDPVAQYACIDNALRAAEGHTVAEHLDQIAELWAAFNRVAGANPDAWFAEPRTAAELREAGPGNRLLAFPYAKWHSTQWAVDQAGAIVLCSVRTARAAGIPPERWVFSRVLVESSHSLSLSRRAEMHRWPAMRVLGDAASAHLGRPLREVDHVELYSCFPAAVRVQQRELRLPLDGLPTLTGGMAFAGGPFNNFTYQATAATVRRLRREPGALGMVSTVSGLLTKPGLAVWSTEPGVDPPLSADLAVEAATATPTRAVTGDAHDTGTVAACTVTGTEPAAVYVIADLSDGRRWVGTAADGALRDAAAGGSEVIGAAVRVDGTTCELA